MDQRGFISSIFDLTFTHFITPKIQRFLYIILLGASAVGALGVIGAALGMAGGYFGKVGALIVGVPLAGLAFLFLAMYFRVLMELVIVVFRGVDYLREIAEASRRGPSV